MVNLKLKIALLEAGVKANELAARLDKHKTQLSKQINGARPFSAEDRRRVAAMLRRPERELFPPEPDAR